MGRMGTSYAELLAQRATQTALGTALQGSSGYFSDPTPDLDPRLFAPGTDSLIPSVRAWVLSTLYQYWERKYRFPQAWSTVWIAGSGITYQWSGGRAVGTEPGDLDVLIGVDWETFFENNPRWYSTSDADMAEQMNEEFHQDLWPTTANATLPGGGNPFEVTFYVNPTATDIRSINPYAAYNVTEDAWTVRPPNLSAHPNQDVPQEWHDRANELDAKAYSALAKYRDMRTTLLKHEDQAVQINAATSLHQILADATMAFEKVHSERRMAFSPNGQGYADFHNWLWQSGKQSGAVQALHALAALDADVHKDVTTQCYRNGLLDGKHLVVLAARAVAHEH